MDGCRIESDGSHMRGVVTKHTTVSGDDRQGKALGMYGAGASFKPTNHPGGRWPANLVLQTSQNPGACPAAYLDEQGGYSRTGFRSRASKDANVSNTTFGVSNHKSREYPGDTQGGASRFYKQVKDMNELNQYLYDMITPTHLEDHCTIVAMDLSEVDWSTYGDSSVHGLIAQGDPEPYMDEIWRVLKPGAHVMLIAPDDQPTGHTGACALEDKGFEIRDAILLVDEPGKLHYVPKAAAKERHAGCEDLKFRRQEREAQQADAEDEDEDLMEGEGEDLDTTEQEDPNFYKGNFHPTVKAREIMRRLLQDIPVEHTVVDPFMGSGSTGLAALQTGHNFIGIEMSEDYIEIADARIRYWDRLEAGWSGAEIESEAPSASEDRATFDPFGF